MKQIRRFIKILMGTMLFAMVGLSGCTFSDVTLDTSDQNMYFIGRVYQNGEIATRAPEATVISRKDFDLKFYVEMETEGEKSLGTYIIPSETNGMLHSYNNKDSLAWHSADKKHTFYSWTTPWITSLSENEPYFNELDEEAYLKDGSDISFNQKDEMYKNVPDNENCKILETFIGAKGGPVSYYENGEYINMRFQHLVSKIYFEQLIYTYTDTDGSVKTVNTNGTIRFTNMPSEAVFVREGENGPYVKAKEGSNYVEYTVGPGKWLYICPEVDFSEVEFSIRASNKDFGEVGEFLGNFSSVKFARDETDWWDAPKKNTVLYAGELMRLRMNLVRGTGTFISVSIQDWVTKDMREGTAYSHNGIYSNNELDAFYNTFNQSTGYTDENEDRMYDIYGEDGEYHLYDDVTSSHGRIPMGKKYPLNGMGHTITFNATYTNNASHGDNYVGIPRARDIYLTDGNGNTVYIDKDFKVYLVNNDGSITPALDNNGKQYELSPLTGSNVKYYVDLITGKVTQTASP